ESSLFALRAGSAFQPAQACASKRRRRVRFLACRDVLAEPVGEFVLGQFAGSEGFEDDDNLGVGCSENKAVDDQEGFADYRRSSLVAVNERVVAGEPEGIGGGQRCGVGLRVLSEIA